MRVTVNGEPREIASVSVDALLGELEYEGTHFAVAVNYDVLPKSRWAETRPEVRAVFGSPRRMATRRSHPSRRARARTSG
jgi:sulfur carrier protein